MKPTLASPRLITTLALAGLVLIASPASAQTPFADLPNLSPAQDAALAETRSTTVPLLAATLTARAALRSAIYATPENGAEIRTKLDGIKSAELAYAQARADVFATLQASPDKLSTEQVEILVWQGLRPLGATRRLIGAFGGGGGGRGGPAPAAGAAGGNSGDGFAGLGVNNRGGGNNANVVPVSDTQQTLILQLNEQPAIVALIKQVDAAKRAAVLQVYAPKKDAAAIEAKVSTWMEAELKLAEAKHAEFGKFQASSPHRLNPAQLKAFAAGTIIRTGL